MNVTLQHYPTAKVFESDSYMWSSKDQLGSGAGGTVYVGYHKVGWDGRGMVLMGGRGVVLVGGRCVVLVGGSVCGASGWEYVWC